MRGVADERPARAVRDADVAVLGPAAGEAPVGRRGRHPRGEAAVAGEPLGAAGSRSRRSLPNVSRLTEIATHVSPASLGKT